MTPLAPAIAALAWPPARAAEAVDALAKRAGLGEHVTEPFSLQVDAARPGIAIAAAAGRLGLEAEPVETSPVELEAFLRAAGPALVEMQGGLLPLLGGGGRRPRVLAPDLTVHEVDPAALGAAFAPAGAAAVERDVDRALDDAHLSGKRRQKARAALLREHLRAHRAAGGWLLRPAGPRGIAAIAREARIPGRAAAAFAAYAVQYGLFVLSWWVLGRAVLDGQVDGGWLVAWALVLGSILPFQLAASWFSGLASIGAGAALKRHLLEGALRIDAELLRRAGAGQLLGRTIESETLERMALSGGFLGLLALVELAIAAFVLSRGAGGAPHAVVLVAWIAVAAAGAVGYYRRRRAWTDRRFDLTNDLVERMVGHRTRLAQEARAHWNDGEDEALEGYLGLSQALDRTGVRFETLVPRGWLVVGLATIAPAFVAGATPAGPLAASIGGVLLAFAAFNRLVDGATGVAAAAIAWNRVQVLSSAATRPFDRELARVALPPAGPPATPSAAAAAPILEGRDLGFRYPGRPEPVFSKIDLRIARGDRILLEGPSGGGKSTLASLLSAGREPGSGLLLLEGLDLASVGTREWRRRVALVPQFHENHILLHTFAFNILMGRRWPPQPADLQEAERVCRALGLGPLLERMPSGLNQIVGETGWQLSHGERSRVYVARALLQGAEVLILDESFASLDPDTLRQAVASVLERAPTVLAIAHP